MRALIPLRQADVIPKIREVHVRNYKSIAQAVVPLSDLTVLVGPNGSGKTNFVDVISFIQEALSASLDVAVQRRGGIESIRRMSTGEPHHIGIRLVIDLGPEHVADYAFEVAGDRPGSFHVVQERCLTKRGAEPARGYVVRDGEFREEIAGIRPRVERDRLALYAASATEDYRPVYDFLAAIQTYRIDPEQVGGLHEPGPGLLLKSDGSNAAGVLSTLQQQDPEAVDRISTLLRRVVAGVRAIRPIALDRWETIGFDDGGFRLPAHRMSEGTLRLLGLLLAVYQPTTPSVLLIEEPEATIHPAAAELVMSVLLDASLRGQVLVTTHSPDILDHKDLSDDAIRIVTKSDGQTTIAGIAASSRQAIREHLYSPGELLRVDELNADEGAATNLSRAADLFGPPAQVRGEAA